MTQGPYFLKDYPHASNLVGDRKSASLELTLTVEPASHRWGKVDIWRGEGAGRTPALARRRGSHGSVKDAPAQPDVDLGGSVRLPLLGFGTWQMTGGECYRAVRHALDVGYRHIDTATIYRNEREVGRALHDSGLRREEVFVTTKIPPANAGRERRTLQASLEALDTAYVDLWLIHWPPGEGVGNRMWTDLIRLRDEAKTRTIGVSNYGFRQLDELAEASGEMPKVNQIRWAPSLYDPAAVDGHRRRHVVLEGYSPFKSTNLRHPALVEVARSHGVTPAQAVLRWHLERGIVVIPKSATPARIEENFDVFGFSLSPEELGRIDGLAAS